MLCKFLEVRRFTQYWFCYKTEWWKINPNNLTENILKNIKIMNILKLTNSERIWSDLISGMNQVINSLAPTWVVHCQKSYQLYIDMSIKEHIEKTNLQLNRAIVTTDTNEWRLFKSLRNQLSKMVGQ